MLPITLFSDFTCPFCYVTEAALLRRVASGEVELRPRAFELFPAPAPAPPPAEEAGWEAEVRPLAEQLSLPLRRPGFRPRTRKAHEAALFAAERGEGARLRDALYRAYWGEARDIGRIDVLAELGEECGLEPAELKIALDIDLHLDSVLAQERAAERLRVTRAPTLFLGTGPGARVRVGLQSPAALDEAIRRGYPGREPR